MMPNVADNRPYQQGYTPSLDDERRIADILRNKSPTPLSGKNPFGTKTEKIDNDLYSNRKSAFGERIHYDPNDGRSNFDRPFFRNPFADVNLASTFDSDLQSYKGLTVHSGPFEIFSRPILIHDAVAKNKSPTNFEFWNNPIKHQNTIANHHLNQHRDHGFLDNAYKSHRIITKPKQNELIVGNRDIGKVPPRPTIGGFYDFERNDAKISYGGFKDTLATWTPSLGAFHTFGARITEKSKCKSQSHFLTQRQIILSIVSICLFDPFDKSAIHELEYACNAWAQSRHLGNRKRESPSLTS